MIGLMKIGKEETDRERQKGRKRQKGEEIQIDKDRERKRETIFTDLYTKVNTDTM